MEIQTVIGNDGSKNEIIANLNKGDKLLCIKSQRSNSGIGYFSTERYDAFEKGKIYEVDYTTNWDGIKVAYVLDEDATCTWARPETFELINKE
jgi:hypothetical protein